MFRKETVIKIDENNRYTSYTIQKRSETEKTKPASFNHADEVSFDDDTFCQIEMDIPKKQENTKSTYDLKPEIIKTYEKDEIRELFATMKDIYRTSFIYSYNRSSYFDKTSISVNSTLFYRQGMLMKDFSDDYEKEATFSGYFPNYQILNYEQLRTYFTWRTKVRAGVINKTCLSYAFMYIYELLNNIGVENAKDGLDKLMTFWQSYRLFDSTIDKYVLRWLKDYHIYYDLPVTFAQFAKEHDLVEHYYEQPAQVPSSNLYHTISKYDIEKSPFYTEQAQDLFNECAAHVIDRIRIHFINSGLLFDEALFRPAKKILVWQPFKDALFCKSTNVPDKVFVFSSKEIYMCKNNCWTFSTTIATDKGRQFIGYVMKKTESVLRELTGYKYKLSAKTDMIDPDTMKALLKAEIHIEDILEIEITSFYKEKTKTIVSVDHDALVRIRKESMDTTKSLIVEQDEIMQADFKKCETESLSCNDIFIDQDDEQVGTCKWTMFFDSLNGIEIKALECISKGGDVQKFALGNNIMPEVLLDCINEKAVDMTGDNVLDENFEIYQDYIEHIKKEMERL